jgi:endonuclease YncB( thermonuclease family)
MLNGKVLSIHDGDTLRVDVTYPVRSNLRMIETLDIRLYGINAPELKSLAGDGARNFLILLLPVGSDVQVEIKGNDKYGGRVDGVIWHDGVSINQRMVESGNAVRMK